MHTLVHENVKKFIDGFHHDAHPMGILVSTVGALSTFYPDATRIYDEEQRRISIYRLIAKMPTLAALAYRHSLGLPYNYPDNDLPVRGQLPEHDVQNGGAALPGGAGDRACPRRALHPPRRSRAELLDKRDADGGFVRTPIPTPRRPLRSPRSTVRCTAGPMRRWCA